MKLRLIEDLDCPTYAAVQEDMKVRVASEARALFEVNTGITNGEVDSTGVDIIEGVFGVGAIGGLDDNAVDLLVYAIGAVVIRAAAPKHGLDPRDLIDCDMNCFLHDEVTKLALELWSSIFPEYKEV